MEPLDIRSPRARWVLLIVAAVTLVAIVDTCRSVSDDVLGARRAATETANCISDCAHAANESIRVESDLHVSNVHACAGDPACLAREEARHEAAVTAIQGHRKDCQNNCHHQGGGSGGR